MISKNIELGIFVSDSKKNMYMIVDIRKKNGNKLMTCIPLIEQQNRKETDRYICSVFSNKAVVVSRPEQIFDYQLYYEKPRMAKDITNSIIEKYKNFKPNLHNSHKTNLNSTSYSDGLRNKNPWCGMGMMNNRPKIYRG